MFGMTRGTLVPARKRLLAFVFAAIAAGPIAASADDGLVDVRTLPRLEGAVENTAHTEPHHLNYGVPMPATVATPAIEKLLAADGWMQYSRPLETSGTSLLFKKERQGLFVAFTQGLRHPDQSGVSYHSSRINADVPFPADATNIMFDDRRPYLGCVSAASVDASLEFFRKEIIASGWSPLSDADIATHWPNAKTAKKIENGVRAYYSQDTHGGYQQPPIVLQEPTLHGSHRFVLVLCIASWQGKHTGNLDHSRGKRRLRVGPDEKNRIVIVAVTVSVLDGCLRLSYAAQSAKGGSSVSLELSVKLFKNIFTSGEQPVAHGDVPVPRESSGKLGLCCA